MNKVSCITVTKNRVPLLKKCIEFFLTQTHQDKELIIVYYNTDLETKLNYFLNDAFKVQRLRNHPNSNNIAEFVINWMKTNK